MDEITRSPTCSHLVNTAPTDTHLSWWLLQLHDYRLKEGANRDLPPRPALVQTQVDHRSTQLQISRGKESSVVFCSFTIKSFIKPSRHPHFWGVVGPGIWAVGELSQHGEYTRWMWPVLSFSPVMSEQKLDQQGGHVEGS